MVKFNPTSEHGSEDDSFYEVGLSVWLVDKDPTKTGVCTIFWPPSEQQVPAMIAKKALPQRNWRLFQVQIKRSYSEYCFDEYSLTSSFFIYFGLIK